MKVGRGDRVVWSAHISSSGSGATADFTINRTYNMTWPEYLLKGDEGNVAKAIADAEWAIARDLESTPAASSGCMVLLSLGLAPLAYVLAQLIA